MKIDVNQILPSGLTLEEESSAKDLDLEADLIKFRQPIKIRADISKVTNAVTVDMTLSSLMYASCSRCLNEFEIEVKKKVRLNFPVDKNEPVVDLNPNIREEIILDYPIKPLCKTECKGLCPKCGKNLNAEECDCKSK